MAFTHALSTNRYGEADLVVSTSASNGTHTTLAGAMADAVSGQTIFLRDSVTENVTITPGVNITAWTQGTLNVPSITGTLTMTGAGTSTVSGLRLVTNGAALIAVTGSAASILNVTNCFLSMGTSAITFSSSSASSRIYFFDCLGNITTTGVKVFDQTSIGTLTFINCLFDNTGLSTTASTISAGNVSLGFTTFLSPITTSGSTCSYSANYAILNCNPINVTALTHGCTSASPSASVKSSYSGGSASAVSIGASASLNSCNDTIGSGNTNAVTGAGTISYSLMSFFAASSTINTTTQTSSGTISGSKNTAPSAGYLGEEMVSNVSAVAFTSNTPKSITSLTLTPGVWDLTGMISFTPTGGALIQQATQVGISTTDNTITGTLGQDYAQFNLATGFGIYTDSVVPLRKVINTSTTYYLVGLTVYTSTTCPGNGRFKATRVG